MSSPQALDSDVRTRLIDAAERLFYRRGVQAVGIDAIVAGAGVATKTLYTCFGSKDGLIEAYLRRRNRRWLDWLRGTMAAAKPGPAQVVAVFDALGEWFAEASFNGCAFINAAGELPTSATARAIARDHKLCLRALLADVAHGCGVADPAVFTERLMLLVEGAIVTAHIEGNPDAAEQASSTAAALLELDTLTGARNAAGRVRVPNGGARSSIRRP